MLCWYLNIPADAFDGFHAYIGTFSRTERGSKTCSFVRYVWCIYLQILREGWKFQFIIVLTRVVVPTHFLIAPVYWVSVFSSVSVVLHSKSVLMSYSRVRVSDLAKGHVVTLVFHAYTLATDFSYMNHQPWRSHFPIIFLGDHWCWKNAYLSLCLWCCSPMPCRNMFSKNQLRILEGCAVSFWVAIHTSAQHARANWTTDMVPSYLFLACRNGGASVQYMSQQRSQHTPFYKRTLSHLNILTRHEFSEKPKLTS